MTREEIIKEIDEAVAELKDAKVKVNEALCHARNIVMYEDDTEAYNKGLEDAWELARKICGAINGQFDNYDTKELGAIFGKCGGSYIINENTYQEALAKIEAYEKEQAEIKVGDVVERMNFTELFVVSGFNEGIYILINANGRCVCANVNQIKKTGKHIDIQSVLQQIGGAE